MAKVDSLKEREVN